MACCMLVESQGYGVMAFYYIMRVLAMWESNIKTKESTARMFLFACCILKKIIYTICFFWTKG